MKEVVNMATSICKRSPLPFLLFLILPRRHPHHLAEQSGEVVSIFYSYLIANLVYLHIREVEQLAGLLYLQLVEIGQRGITSAFAEQDGEVGGGIAGMGGQVGQGKAFLQVLFHIMDGGGYDIVFVGLFADGFAILLQVTQGSQVIMEGGAGIQQVFVAVSHLERTEYLFEKLVAVADAGLYARFDFYRAGSLSGKVGCQLTFEMYPIDRPGIDIV